MTTITDPSALLVATARRTVLNIFVSSTCRDYEAFRREVQDVLNTTAECTCFLSEDWVVGHNPTVNECWLRVQAAGGFILLLGYWYGSVPPGEDKSITHLEFEWAKQKWRGISFPPMAVFRPEPGSDADSELMSQARALIPHDPETEKHHASCLADFHGLVGGKLGEWHMIQQFKNRQELREKALALAKTWWGYSLVGVSMGQVKLDNEKVESRLPEHLLGKLGRETQAQAMKRILARLAGEPDVPDVAFVVSGREGVGQRAFMTHAVATVLEKYRPKRRIGRLPSSRASVAVLTSWVAKHFGIECREPVEDPGTLAKHIADELKHGPLYFVVDRIGGFDGGVRSFQKNFWDPLWKRLLQLRAEMKLSHRLVALIADYTGAVESWGDAVAAVSDAGKLNYEKLLLLPCLDNFSRDDLFEWLEKMNVPDEPAGRRMELVERVLNDECGHADGIPQHVFDRLLSENLWPEGEMP